MCSMLRNPDPYMDGVIAWVWHPQTYQIAGNDYSIW